MCGGERWYKIVSIKYCLVRNLQLDRYMIENIDMKRLASYCSFHNVSGRSRIKKQIMDLAQICLSDCDFEEGVKNKKYILNITYISVLISGFHISILFRNGVDVMCDWTVQWTTGHCVPPLAQDCGDGAMVGGAVAHCPDSFTEQRLRIAFLSLYIDTYCDECKIWKRCLYFLILILSNWDVWSQNPYHSLMCDLCHVFIVVLMSKLRNPTGEGARHGDNITRQHSQFTAPGQQVH